MLDFHATLLLFSYFHDHKLVVVVTTTTITLISLFFYYSTRSRPILLLDHASFKPDSDRKLSYEASEYFVRRSRRFGFASQEFMRAIYIRSGLGHETYAPPFIFKDDYEHRFSSAIEEADEGLFTAVETVLGKTGIEVGLIGSVIVACGMFSPSPSLSARVVNRFGFRSDVKTFNLTGMGCSVGAVALDLAAKILSGSRSINYVLVVVTENISLNWYIGKNRSMLVSNCIFRLGSAAAIVTNDLSQRKSAKYELSLSLTTHHGADDASYGVVFQEEDDDGIVGVTLKKDLMNIASARLRDHVTILAPWVLPLGEIIRYVYNQLAINVFYKIQYIFLTKHDPSYMPDFTKAFEHMCVHAGGRAVVEAVEEVMGLDEGVMEPARMTLHRFGNSSGPLLFYELAYFEGKGRIKKGDRVWMVSFGAGFMVCSLVWKSLRDSYMDESNPWKDCAHIYPVNTTTIA